MIRLRQDAPGRPRSRKEAFILERHYDGGATLSAPSRMHPRCGTPNRDR